MKDEHHLFALAARRKGRSQSPCTLIVGVSLHRPAVVLRFHDQSGRPSAATNLSPDDACRLADALLRAAIDAA